MQLRDDIPTILDPNTWSTFGGALEPGETPLQAMKREAFEEIEYELKNPEYVSELRLGTPTAHIFRKVDFSI